MRIYDSIGKQYFRSQDRKEALWDAEGIDMEQVDAEIRVMIIEKNFPGKYCLEIQPTDCKTVS